MPRAKITVGVVRNPNQLCSALNDLQVQISRLRVDVEDLKKKPWKKRAKSVKKGESSG